MPIILKASDLKFRYPRDVANRDEPKFAGLPDPAPFNRHDLYEILPMLSAVMDELESDDGEVLHLVEDAPQRDAGLHHDPRGGLRLSAGIGPGMLETVGDIWEYAATGIIVITTNGSLTRDGRAIFGRGVAKQAALRYPGLAEKLGRLLADQGNHVFDLGSGIVTFPVEETPWSLPDLRIIARSAGELRLLADRSGWEQIVVPRPGCGGGGLLWEDVRSLLEPCFDQRFLVINQIRG